jgi:hypothetical protein
MSGSPETVIKNQGLSALATALISGVHWGQVLRQEKPNSALKGDPVLFGRGKLPAGRPEKLFDNFKKLVTTPPPKIVAWVEGQENPEISALVKDLIADPIPDSEKLPVNVMIAYMRKRLTGPEDFFVRAVANMVQLCLEVDHDGTYLQNLFSIYIALGVKQVYLPTDDAEQIAAGKELAPQCCKCPYEVDAAAFHAIIKKIVQWTTKNSGQRDRYVLAREMLEDPEVKPLIPKLKALSARRVAFLGHSMMMSLHWSTYGSWTDVASETVKLVNPKFEHRPFQSGGLHASWAVKAHLSALLDYKPTETWIEVAMYTPEDTRCLDQIAGEVRKLGSTLYIVDDVRPWSELDPAAARIFAETCEKHGGKLMQWHALGKKQPGYERWQALDVIHMVTEGHLFYAKQTLKVWAGS